MSSSIPAISLQSLLEQKESDLLLLNDALHSHGFFSIVDHDIETDLLKESYKQAKIFFDLPEETKNQYARPELGGARGYTPFGKETALGEKVADMKEFWHLGPEINESYDSRINNNLSVVELEHFNIHFNQLFNKLNKLGICVLESIAIILKQPKDFFTDKVEKGNSILRLIHYPPVEGSSNLLRARAHADINLITLLVGAEEAGLEVQSKDNNWIPVSANSNAIVCNIGDMMQLITDGHLKSTPHRVIEYNKGKSKSRFSMPFFLHPAPGVVLKSIFRDDDEGVLAHDFLEERVKAIKLY